MVLESGPLHQDFTLRGAETPPSDDVVDALEGVGSGLPRLLYGGRGLDDRWPATHYVLFGKKLATRLVRWAGTSYLETGWRLQTGHYRTDTSTRFLKGKRPS